MQEPEELRSAVAAVFGDRTDLARRYAGHLVTSAVERGLVGPREVDRIWDRHVLNCAVVAELLPTGSSVVDVGSGAGLPGLCLALARPDAVVVLVEPLERRATWLREVVDDLGLAASVRVVRARAEQVVPGRPGGLEPADVATARAVAPLERLAGWCLPLLRPGGRLLALKGRTAAAELDSAHQALERAGATESRVVVAGDGVVALPTTVVSVTVGAAHGPVGRAPGPSRSGRGGRGGGDVGGRSRTAGRQRQPHG